MFYEAVFEKVAAVVAGPSSRDEKLGYVARLLREAVPYYDWVGFYLVDPERPGELVLGPFVGNPTEHVRIPFGRGVCGRVAKTRETAVVQNVSELNNYLACDAEVQSEIVVPILKAGNFVGELDIDSHALAPFAKGDEALLKRVAAMVADLL
jgi:L-methionine (R)-S-oxide reductase